MASQMICLMGGRVSEEAKKEWECFSWRERRKEGGGGGESEEW